MTPAATDGGRHTSAAARREKTNTSALTATILPGSYREVTDRMAADTVRRFANQHDCHQASTGEPCAHPDHRRDVLFSRYLLDMLDIPRDTAPPSETDRRDFIDRLRETQSYTAVPDIRPAGSLY